MIKCMMHSVRTLIRVFIYMLQRVVSMDGCQMRVYGTIISHDILADIKAQLTLTVYPSHKNATQASTSLLAASYACQQSPRQFGTAGLNITQPVIPIDYRGMANQISKLKAFGSMIR